MTTLKADTSIGRILIPGSISIVQQLLAAVLVDELSLMVHPVAARTGQRLFDESEVSYHLSLMQSEVFPTGVVWLRYATTTAPDPVGYNEVKDQVPDTRGDS